MIKRSKSKKFTLHKTIVLSGILFSIIIILVLIQSNNKSATPDRTFANENLSRGYFTSIDEVQSAKLKYQSGDSGMQAKVAELLTFAGEPGFWTYGNISGQITAPASGTCSSPQDSSGPSFLKYNEGARLVYAKVLAYYMTGNQLYAQVARDKIIELTGTSYFGGEIYSGANQCILELSFSVPLWIQSADLLAGTGVWSLSDKNQFQDWLISQVYHKVAWASRYRANNWGSFGSNAAVMLADYVSDRDVTLNEIKPLAKTLTPVMAYQEHVIQAKNRMTGVFKGDSSCPTWGIQSHGGIPDELRRGAAGCSADSLQTVDNSLVYQSTHTDSLIIMADFLWHRGDTSLYTLISDSGMGSIKKAIHFIINNPNNASTINWEWYRRGHLYVANRFYHDAYIRNVANSADPDAYGTFLAFAQITHFDENSIPPIVAPPGQTSSPTASPISMPTTTPSPSPVPTPSPIVTDTILPTVAITNPVNLGTVIPRTTVTLAATASDASGISSVMFYVNGSRICTDSASPYTCSWRVPRGTGKTYTIKAEATDTKGNKNSHTISVTSK